MEHIEILLFVGENHNKSYKSSLIKSTLYYANVKNVKYHICDIHSINTIKLSSIKAVFFPLNFISWATDLDLEIFNILHDDMPLVFDLDMPIKKSINLSNKKIAIRAAFGEIPSLNFTPEYTIPMLPLAIKYSADNILKDVIMVDVKSFHYAADTHFYVLSILANMAREWLALEEIVGHKLYIYLTSFMQLSQYINVFKSLVEQQQFRGVNPNTFDILNDRLIENIASNEEFENLKLRTRLFITEHGNLADADLVEALCIGTPLLTYKRFCFTRTSGIHHSAINALKYLDKDIEQRIAFADFLRMKEEYGLRNIITLDNVKSWNAEAYEEMFLKSYDLLIDWILDGTIVNEVNLNMKNCFFRDGIERDVKNFNMVKNIVNISKGHL